MSGAFSPRAAVVLVLATLALLLGLGWAVGAGYADGDLAAAGDGGHAGGVGLNGYAGLYRLLGNTGYRVSMAADAAGFGDSEAQKDTLLVLTPLATADPKVIDAIVAAHRRFGPVLVVQPKWQAFPAPAGQPGARHGWNTLIAPSGPNWPGFRDDVTWQIKPLPGGLARMPGYGGGAGLVLHLPAGGSVVSATGQDLMPLVAGSDGRMLAFYTTDGGPYAALARIAVPGARAGQAQDCRQRDTCLYPLIFVVEPDLFNNWGMARPENAAMAESIVAATFNADPRQPATHDERVVFDVTLAGLSPQPNPLSIAFAPPWVAATLCLILAMFAVIWRGALRFGPVLRPPRAIAFGKAALLASSAGLVLRARRHNLLANPYAAAVRERIARRLGLPRGDPDAQTAAIDRALARRSEPPGAEPADAFSAAAAALTGARGPAAILRAAQRLHSLESRFNQGR